MERAKAAHRPGFQTWLLCFESSVASARTWDAPRLCGLLQTSDKALLAGWLGGLKKLTEEKSGAQWEVCGCAKAQQ